MPLKRTITATLILLASLLLTAVPAVADTYIVAVGINRYKHNTGLHVSEDDAKGFAELCRKFPGAHVNIVTGRYATRERLQKVIAKAYAGTSADDPLMFYFSGHGSPSGCAAYDTPAASGGRGFLTFDYIASVMKKSPARRKIIISDSCYSGASRSSKKKSRTHRRADPNVILFMSSRANETSLEAIGGTNSIFTRYLLKGMGGAADANGDRLITARELFNYVSSQVEHASQGKQHPVMWGNFDENFIIFRR